MHLTGILKSDTDKLTKAGTVWTLGMIGQHSAEHARSICSCDALTNIVDVISKNNNLLQYLEFIFISSIFRFISIQSLEARAETNA